MPPPRASKQNHDRFTLDDLAVAKRYLEYKMRVLAVFTGRDRPPIEYRAVFERKLPVKWLDRNRVEGPNRTNTHPGRWVVGRLGTVKYAAHVGGPYGNEQLVLVENVQSVECPQGVIPSTVRSGQLH
jgi:hypothetical protein